MTAPTSAERSAYWAWTQSEINKLARPIPELLWHYTDGSALISILQNGSLWATQVSCLNDYSELSYAMRLVRGELDAIKATNQNPSVQHLLEIAIEGLHDKYVASNECFVCCLSENGDDLSQWRAYGAGEGGYAIGLSSRALVSAMRGSFLAPVNYSAATHASLSKNIAAELVRSFLQGIAANSARAAAIAIWTDQFLTVWRDCLTYLAPALKDPAFAAEHEWRIIHRLGPDDSADLIFRQKRTLMSRHLPLRFPPTDGSKVLPIVQISVGPSRNAHVSKISVGDLLKNNGYAGIVSVSTSPIPYQSP